MKNPMLYVRTLIGLRPVQWFYLPVRWLQARLPAHVRAPSVWLAALEQDDVIKILAPNTIEEAVERAEAIVRREFSFLGHRKHLPEINWSRQYHGYLWNYNLHYFDYARDLAWAHRETREARFAETFSELAISWVRGTKPGRGEAWEPYPVSLRVVNWLLALSSLGTAIPPDAQREITESLAKQVVWLERRLERHLQANHLQKNFHALAVAGLFFSGGEAGRWREKGLRGSWECVREQVLEDGGHYERSSMYHAIALADFLELIALCDASAVDVPGDVRHRVARMLEAFGVLSRPNGLLHLFNDAAQGVAPSRAKIDDLGQHVLGKSIPVPKDLLSLPMSGYYGLQTSSGERLLIDCGTPGPRHQPGHAHCDVLSFELDVDGRQVVVDSGTYGYEVNRYRDYVRSTRAHNTVVLDGNEQSELWGTFRIARMATVQNVQQLWEKKAYRWTGSYSPYFDSKIRHQRTVRFTPGRLKVRDRISGASNLPVSSFLHLHPSFIVRIAGSTASEAIDEAGRLLIEWTGVNNVRIGRGGGNPEGWYCPKFGHAEPAPVIMGELEAQNGELFGYDIIWD